MGMKKNLLLTLIAGSLVLNTFATVRTVSNHPAGGSQYSTLQNAYDAANDGDTLLIEGSTVAYQSPSVWVKLLVVIGPGIKTIKQGFHRAELEFFVMGTGGGGSKFYGIKLQAIEINQNVNGLIFEDCLFDYYLYLGTSNNNNITNITVKNCIFSTSHESIYSSSNTISNLLITNCLFNGSVSLAVITNNPVNTIIDHCVFLWGTIEKLSNSVVKNCVFYNVDPVFYFGNNVLNCDFSNNICRLASTLPGPNNFGSGNLTNTNPNFVNVPFNTYYSLTKTFNFNLLPGSLGIGTANDGSDIGVHGGFANTFTEEFEPKVTPIIRVVQLQNNIVGPNGSINIEIQAGKPAQ